MKLTRAKELFDIFKSKRVLVVGDIMLDTYLWGSANRISPEAPVPIVAVKNETYTPGGAGNVALNLVGLGCKVEMAGILGNDEPGNQLKKIFEEQGVGTSAIITDSSRTTSVKTRIIAQDQQVVRVDRESNDPVNKELVDSLIAKIGSILNEFDGIILEDYNKGLLTPYLIQKIISDAGDSVVPVYVDPKRDNFDLYRNTRLFKPNLSEFLTGIGKHVSGDEFYEEGNSFRKRNNIDLLVVTRGPEGISVFTADGVHEIPTRARKVHDVSGAGDTVISIFSLADLSGANPEEAASLANYGAGRVCEEVGVVPITIEMLSGYLEEHNSH